jgi:uncharacterized protein YndB with AHSA1/START domain
MLNEKLDLVLEREIEIPVEWVWKAWTNPEIILEWFTPSPWKTVECNIDLFPGGIFQTVMLSPEGDRYSNSGCYLEIIENKKLVWTDALLPGFRPAPSRPADSMSFITACIELTPTQKGCIYKATAYHPDELGREKHFAMGFHQGWGIALDQLISVTKRKF